MRKNFYKIIDEICREKNIKLSILSKDWIMVLEKNNVTRFIAGYKFDLNRHGIGTIVDDKYGFYEVIKDKNIPIIEHKIMYGYNNTEDFAQNCNTFEYALEYLKNNNNDIVIKPNDGTCGANVFHIQNVEELEQELPNLLKKKYSISLCPFYKIKTEYRSIVLNNECLLMYGKKRPIIIGNGQKTIKELLQEFNYNYFKNEQNFNSNYDINYIPKENEKIEYSWKFNLSQGSQIVTNIDKDLEDKILTIALKTASEINLTFGSIDIIETENNELLVLEANSGVMMENLVDLLDNGYQICKDIYAKAIDFMMN